MSLQAHQTWLRGFYQRRGWYQLSPFIRINFLTEEVGELSRAVRAIEIGREHPGEKEQTPAQKDANLKEELADVLDQVLIIASKYDIDPETLLAQSETKLHRRFPQDQG